MQLDMNKPFRRQERTTLYCSLTCKSLEGRSLASPIFGLRIKECFNSYQRPFSPWVGWLGTLRGVNARSAELSEMSSTASGARDYVHT